jgi:hypothetical protein
MVKINNINEFKKEIQSGVTDFFISFDVARSSKTILSYEDDQTEILNEIDDSVDVFSDKELKKSNIGKAIEKGAFYKY